MELRQPAGPENADHARIRSRISADLETLRALYAQASSRTERREWIEIERLALRQASARALEARMAGLPVAPDRSDFFNRRRLLRLVALEEGLRDLKSVQDAGGDAVLFGSVLTPFRKVSPGYEGFREDSDIDICLLDPPDFMRGAGSCP